MRERQYLLAVLSAVQLGVRNAAGREAILEERKINRV
jgi:hypothetical protein